LKLKEHDSQLDNSSNNGGTLNLVNSSGSMIQTGGSANARQKKYRTLSRIKGLFLTQNRSESDALHDLPPHQLKNELAKKIANLNLDIEKQHKERLNKNSVQNKLNLDFNECNTGKLTFTSQWTISQEIKV
jgi:hypothetical protein